MLTLVCFVGSRYAFVITKHLQARQDSRAVLGVKRTSSLKEMKSAFRRLARDLHPDKNDSPQAAAAFKAAQDALSKLSPTLAYPGAE